MVLVRGAVLLAQHGSAWCVARVRCGARCAMSDVGRRCGARGQHCAPGAGTTVAPAGAQWSGVLGQQRWAPFKAERRRTAGHVGRVLAPTRSRQHVRPCTCTPIPTCLRERRAPTCFSIAHARSSPRARAPRHAQVTFMNAQGDIVNRKREYVHYGCRGDWWVALIGGGCSSCANSCAPSGSLVAWS